MWYLVYKYYDLRSLALVGREKPNPIERDYIGPFPAQYDAQNHQANYGPLMADIVRRSDPPEPLMSPTEHVEYLKARV